MKLTHLSPIQIFSELHAGLFAQGIGRDTALIKWKLKVVGGQLGAELGMVN
jgi:hypothetical protein